MERVGAGMDRRRIRLKAITAPQHDAVDAMIASGALLDTVSGYRRYLAATLSARRCVETSLTRSGAADLYPAWARRRIEPLVEADLADIAPALPAEMGGSSGAAMSAGSMLGALYVLEGSAMGARVIARRVARIGMGPGFGARHLHHQAAEPRAWPEFLDLLEVYPLTDQDDDACLHQAVATFECFRSHYATATR